MFIKECGQPLIDWEVSLVEKSLGECLRSDGRWDAMMPASPPLIKPLLQGVETWRGLHNALQCAGMGQSQWTAGSEKDRQRKSRGERHLRHLRLSPFHLQPDSYFLKLSTRWRLCDYSLPSSLSLSLTPSLSLSLPFSLSFSLSHTFAHTHILLHALGLLLFLPLVEDSRIVHSNACGRLRLPIPSAKYRNF